MAYRSIKFRPAQLNDLLRAPNGTVGQHMASLGRKSTAEAKRLADAELERHTGAYHGAFRSHTEVGPKGPRMVLENTSVTKSGRALAPLIEKGTRPHVIRPRRAKVLAFVVDGRRVFSRLVHHPGTKAYRIMERAVRRAIGR